MLRRRGTGVVVPRGAAARLRLRAVAVVLGQDGDPLYASKHQYIVNRRLRRALQARDGRCRFPGCDHRARLQVHHITHWVAGGPTVLANLVMLGAKHHRAVHEGGFTLHGNAGADGHAIDVRRPDGTVLTRQQAVTEPVTQPVSAVATIEAQHGRLGLDIDADTNRCGWEGRSPNLSDIIGYFDSTAARRAAHDRN